MTAQDVMSVRVVIRGKVQGVGFRAWTRGQAELHGLDGWVRNLRDGSVEAVFRGPDDAVEIVLKACGAGPLGAVVEQFEQYPADPTEALIQDGGFTALPTA